MIMKLLHLYNLQMFNIIYTGQNARHQQIGIVCYGERHYDAILGNISTHDKSVVWW